MTTILETAAMLIEEARNFLTMTSTQEIETEKDKVIEFASAIQTSIDQLEDGIAAKRKEKRLIDDSIQALQSELRRYDHANKDLTHMSRRLTGRFWDLKREANNSNMNK